MNLMPIFKDCFQRFLASKGSFLGEKQVQDMQILGVEFLSLTQWPLTIAASSVEKNT